MANSPDPKPANLNLYVRLATQEDVEDIVDVIYRAFMHDPVLNYLGSVKKVRGMYIASNPSLTLISIHSCLTRQLTQKNAVIEEYFLNSCLWHLS